MVFVFDAFLDFVMFAVVCVSRGPNVELTVGKKQYIRKNLGIREKNIFS